MKHYILILASLICATAAAQDKYFYLGLDINKPLSNTAWIKDISTSGARAGYRVFLTDRISAGVDISGSAYDQYFPTETFQNGNGALTTDYFNYVYSYALTASAQYYFLAEGAPNILPYAGLGLGANNNEYVVYYNIYQDVDRSWGFLVRPEAGVLVKFGSRGSIGAMAAIHYDYSTNKSETFDYKNFSNIGFQVGIVMFQR